MTHRLTSLLLTVLICFGMLLPKLGAVMVDWVPGMTQAVICTGSEIVVLTLNAEGEPVELPEPIVDHCMMSDVTPEFDTPHRFWVRLARSYHRPFVENTDEGSDALHLMLVPPAQAPPWSA